MARGTQPLSVEELALALMPVTTEDQVAIALTKNVTRPVTKAELQAFLGRTLKEADKLEREGEDPSEAWEKAEFVNQLLRDFTRHADKTQRIPAEKVWELAQAAL